jgi:hypothetical protein
MAFDGYTLLGGTLLADVHLRPNTIGDLGQVNSRILVVTNLTLHIDPPCIIPEFRLNNNRQI